MRRCNQCWRWLPPEHFWSERHGRHLQDCDACRANRRAPVKSHRIGLPVYSELRVSIIPESKNRKLGPIPAVYVTASTCPPSCGMYNAGCYGEHGLMRHHWREVDCFGVSWSELCDFVSKLPAEQLWRYGVLGDLPGEGDEIDCRALADLVIASKGTRGFAFTHKRKNLSYVSQLNRYAVKYDLDTLTINLSADNLAQADELYEHGPVAVVLPIGAPRRLNTPAGHLVVQCPATYQDNVTCATCGLCARAGRKSIVGFPAHGLRKREVSERAK
jgi:hypothetical protein